MAKKLGKALLATAIIGTAAAGAYYYLKKKKEAEPWFIPGLCLRF